MKLPPREGQTGTGELLAYFAITFAWSWTCWLLAAASDDGPGLLLYAGIPGPLLAALAMLYLRGTRTERRDLLRSVYQLERLKLPWLLLVLLLYPLLTGLAVGMDLLLGGEPPDAARLMQRLHQPTSLLAAAGLLLLLGPLPEEPGWRGYALPRLLRFANPLTASLGLGLVWGLWHLPLFLVPGTYQQQLGLGSPGFWLFMLTALAGSVLITWVWRHNDKSVFAAILLHAVLNLTRDSLPLDERAELLRTALLLAMTTCLVLRGGPGLTWPTRPRVRFARR